MKFGANTFIWFSPVTVDDIKSVAPAMAEGGFDIIELPLEAVDGFNYDEAGAVIKDNGLEVSTCAVVTEDRDLIHADAAIRENGKAYIRHCIDAFRIGNGRTSCYG